MKHILFFALKEDLLKLLELVESKGLLKYARMGNFPRVKAKEGISAYQSCLEIPNLGLASAESSAACESFLICEPESQINLRPVQGNNVCIDQLANPDSISFTPGGIWNEDIVLHGRVATVSESPASQALMKRFHAAIKATFSKVKAFYVGPKALSLLEGGKRLTISAQSPRDFDLTRDGTKD